jgi:hypothetical protein
MNKIKYILISLLFYVLAMAAKADEALTYEERIVALTILGEARGEGKVGMYAVGCVIQKRVIMRKFSSPAKVCLEPWQFSVWNAGRGKVKKESELYHLWKSSSMQYARKLARDICKKDLLLTDVTGGADHYCTLTTKPYWSFKTVIKDGKKVRKAITPSATIGNHKFYNLKQIGQQHEALKNIPLGQDVIDYYDLRSEQCQLPYPVKERMLLDFKKNKKGVLK